MTSLPAAVCSRCQRPLPAGSDRCLTCGPTARQNLRALVDNPYLVLGTIFFVTAALGLPLIWMCRAWSPLTKVLLTIVTLLYTALILWLFWLVMAWCYQRIIESL